MTQGPVIRVIEGGGKGFRRTDVCDGKRSDIMLPGSEIDTPADLVAFASRDLPAGTAAIAYSVAGIIEGHSKVVVSPNIHFLDGAELGPLTRESSKLPAFVYHDMETSVEGMHVMFPFLSYFVALTWSSGLGMRVFKDGKIISDSEGGHVCIDHSMFAQLCGCGRRGCAEAIVAGKGVGRRIVAELDARGHKMPEGMSVFELLDADYLMHEPWALDIYKIITTGMGLYLAALQTIFHAPALIWKGTFAKKSLALPGIEKAIRATMRKKLMESSWEKDLQFYRVCDQPGYHDDDESFLGAGKLALDTINQS